MAFQTTFMRREIKFLLTKAQKERIMQEMEPYMVPDQYGRSTIRNLYFDDDSYRLIRRSIERPDYKEKLRIRSYQKADSNSIVFVELKKKYKKVVYKRRLSLTEQDAMEWLCEGQVCPKNNQIAKEISYFMSFYQSLRPVIFLSYQREAFYGKDSQDFRITFDDTILCRQHELSLTADVGGTPILPGDTCLMEVKCFGGLPLWLVNILSREKLYKTSFSKYGTAYEKFIFPQLKEKKHYA